MYKKTKLKMKSKKLKTSFYLQDTISVARSLLGKRLVRRTKEGKKLSGLIVETEAYLGAQDPACHSYLFSKTSRTQALYLPGGHAYVYLTYGLHFCFNVVTCREEEPEAVLIRALEPIEGEKTMFQNRFSSYFESQTKRNPKKTQLTNGPGKLCQALEIDRSLNKMSLLSEKIFVEETGWNFSQEDIQESPRIGLGMSSQDALFWPLRFFLKNPFVSAFSFPSWLRE